MTGRYELWVKAGMTGVYELWVKSGMTGVCLDCGSLGRNSVQAPDAMTEVLLDDDIAAAALSLKKNISKGLSEHALKGVVYAKAIRNLRLVFKKWEKRGNFTQYLSGQLQ